MAATGAGLTLERLVAAQPLQALPTGRLLRTMPLGRLDGRPQPPLHRLLGSGLDARQFTDLAGLDPDRLVTPTARFYIRTARPQALPAAAGWRIAIGGPAGARALTIDALRAQARSMGTHIMECAGNADPANFGLLSAADWTGVPMTAILDGLQIARPTRIRVSGLDDDRPSESSVAGASWVFTRDELDRAGAFLATEMNGAPLPLDHGSPVRLVVPNYYGCACIKWVSRIDAVPDDEPATTQMKEFSARTHQRGVLELARDYEPPAIDLAATPVRVEQWLVDGRISYRIVGIRWGGSTRRAPLLIRFKHTERFAAVDDCPPSPNLTTWSLWSHLWRPAAPGRYEIALNTADRSIRTRRLDLFYYTREVAIDRV
jgi:DMSO/TMAO reductase YedYZ molybdopterin-dependent catalytic subunit